MVGFGEIMHQSEEKWRADVLEQVCAIRKLLEALVEKKGLSVTFEATNVPGTVDSPAWISPYEFDSTAGRCARPGPEEDVAIELGG